MIRILTAVCAILLSVGQPAAAEPVIKIGILTDMTGIFADPTGPGSLVAARLAVEDYAASPHKYSVSILSADHQNRADLGSQIARRWIDVDGVSAIFDLPNSAVALAVNEIGRTMNKAVIVSSGGSAALTGSACSPTTVHWTYDNWALANAAVSAVVKSGGDGWFFIVADYAFGNDLYSLASGLVVKNGGRVVGKASHPIGATDYASLLLQAQSSGAKIVALANAGQDMATSVKQGQEFGLAASGQRVLSMITTINDIHGLGLASAKDTLVVTPFYWDLNDETRAWSKRFADRMKGQYPSMMQAGVYSSVLHYLKALEASNNSNGDAVVSKMKEIPTNDPLFGIGKVRSDGRKIHPMYLYAVKKPSESKYPWDYQKLLQTISAEDAFRPPSPECPLNGSGWPLGSGAR